MPEYCVTGGTGFIAAHLIRSLLQQGHTVRATVRDPENVEKVGFLKEMDGANERLKLYKADLMVEGSFDDAIHGVDGVFHTACPVYLPHGCVDFQETLGFSQLLCYLRQSLMRAGGLFWKQPPYSQGRGKVCVHLTFPRPLTLGSHWAMLIDPCIKGTLNVLSSCIKAGCVKRVVLTGSTASIRTRGDAEQVSPLNESHWSDPEYCKQHNLWYAYAKTLGEKAAWEMAEKNGLDLVVVNPSFVVGPLLSPQPTSTLQVILSLIKGIRGECPNRVTGFVHIDDVIAAHILAMEEKKASGRLVCSSSVIHFVDLMKMLKAKYPMYPFESKLGNDKGEDDPHSMDTSKIMELGFPGFKTIPQMFDDFIKSFQDEGFL